MGLQEETKVSLDSFLVPHVIEERCSDCGKILGKKRPKYTLKNKDAPYCRDCAVKRMPKPESKETSEEEEEKED